MFGLSEGILGKEMEELRVGRKPKLWTFKSLLAC